MSGVATKGYDNSGETFCINFTDTSNEIIVKNLQGEPFGVNIFGEVLQVGGTNSADPSQLILTFPAPPPSGTREDLVFLEVWYQNLLSQEGPDASKPSSTTVWGYGNIQYGGVNPNDGIYYAPIGIATTNRVQLQYRIRVVAGVDFVSQMV